MATPEHRQQLERGHVQALNGNAERIALKIVCFDDADLLWAKEIASSWPELDLYLSAGLPSLHQSTCAAQWRHVFAGSASR